MKQHKEDSAQPQIDEELSVINSLLRSESFALTVAEAQNKAYYIGIGESPKPLLEPGDDTAHVTLSKKEEKIATSLAGFYALECGLDYLVTTQQKLPSNILKSILDDSISTPDKQLLCRFANATWKAGQPFRGLDRITRDIFTPFRFLAEADIDKDWVQVKAAAELLLKKL